MSAPIKSIIERLTEFKSLKDGWLDGEGFAYNPIELDWLSNQFIRNYNGSSFPFTFPMPKKDHIQFEWDEMLPELIVDLQSKTGTFNQIEYDLTGDLTKLNEAIAEELNKAS